MRTLRMTFLLAAAGLLGAGCLQVLGLDDFREDGSGAASGSSTSSSMTGSSSGGPCVLDAPCYSGEMGTEGKGNCKAGTQVCDGSILTSCAGEVIPATEDFYAKGDESCDGHARADLASVSEHPGLPSGVQRMAVDGDGNLVVAGFFQPSVNFGPNATDTLIATDEQDFFVAKFDPTGKFLWSKRFGDATNELIVELAITPDKRIWLFGVFKDPIKFGATTLHATNNSAFFIAQLDANGDPLQARAIDTRPQPRVGLAALPGGDVVIAGGYNTTADLGLGAPLSTTGIGSFVARIRGTDLGTDWVRSLTDSTSGAPDGDQAVRSIASDAGGNVLAIGTFTGSITAGNHIAQCDGGLDGFAFRFTPDGDENGLLQMGGVGDAAPEAVAADLSGSFAITGTFTNTVRLVDSGNIAATFSAAGGTTDSDLFVWRVTAAGAHAWSKQLGDASAQASSDPTLFSPAVAFAPDGRLVQVGRFNGSLDIGGQKLTSKGADDALLAVYAPDGTAEWAKSFGDGTPLQTGTAVVVRGTDLFAAFVNSGTMDLGTGPLSAQPPDTSEFLLARFEL